MRYQKGEQVTQGNADTKKEYNRGFKGSDYLQIISYYLAITNDYHSVNSEEATGQVVPPVCEMMISKINSKLKSVMRRYDLSALAAHLQYALKI